MLICQIYMYTYGMKTMLRNHERKTYLKFYLYYHTYNIKHSLWLYIVETLTKICIAISQICKNSLHISFYNKKSKDRLVFIHLSCLVQKTRIWYVYFDSLNMQRREIFLVEIVLVKRLGFVCQKWIIKEIFFYPKCLVLKIRRQKQHPLAIQLQRSLVLSSTRSSKYGEVSRCKKRTKRLRKIKNTGTHSIQKFKSLRYNHIIHQQQILPSIEHSIDRHYIDVEVLQFIMQQVCQSIEWRYMRFSGTILFGCCFFFFLDKKPYGVHFFKSNNFRFVLQKKTYNYHSVVNI